MTPIMLRKTNSNLIRYTRTAMWLSTL